jgi:serine protease Do
MHEEPNSSGSTWPDAPSPATGALDVESSSTLRPLRQGETVLEPVSADSDGGRLHRLLWIFAILTVALVTPSMISRIEYARTAARERARYDVARENREAMNLEQISAAYRMIPQLISPSVVNIRTHLGMALGQGSGVIVDKAGFIITNAHVVEGVRTAEIQLSDGRRGTATVRGVDPQTDIAVLRTEMDDLVPAEWGDSADLEVGELVWAVGSPFGLQKSVTSGILSAKERRGVGGGVLQEFLQSDAAVNPGNSGGPLIDIHGKVIGINTAIVGDAYQGISFAIPSELARESYERLRRDGYIEHGFLGIRPEPVPDHIADDLDLEREHGVWVAVVQPDSPADAAGVRINDVIVEFDGQEYSDPTLLSRAIASKAIGTEVAMKIVRASFGGVKELELKVRVAPRPKE